MEEIIYTLKTADREGKKMRAIIFDFDYTLGDSTKGIVQSVNYALGKLGYANQSVAEIKKTIGLSLKETFRALTSNENQDEAEKFAVFFKEKADVVMTANTEIYPKVKDILQNLKVKGYKTAIVTTKYHHRIDGILKKFNATHLIDLIVGSDDVKVEKPNPEGLLFAIEHLGVKKEEVLYVGDSLVDAKTADNAGVDFAAVLTGTTKREEFATYCPVFVGDSVADVYEYIYEYINEK